MKALWHKILGHDVKPIAKGISAEEWNANLEFMFHVVAATAPIAWIFRNPSFFKAFKETGTVKHVKDGTYCVTCKKRL